MKATRAACTRSAWRGGDSGVDRRKVPPRAVSHESFPPFPIAPSIDGGVSRRRFPRGPQRVGSQSQKLVSRWETCRSSEHLFPDANEDVRASSPRVDRRQLTHRHTGETRRGITAEPVVAPPPLPLFFFFLRQCVVYVVKIKCLCSVDTRLTAPYHRKCTQPLLLSCRSVSRPSQPIPLKLTRARLKSWTMARTPTARRRCSLITVVRAQLALWT